MSKTEIKKRKATELSQQSMLRILQFTRPDEVGKEKDMPETLNKKTLEKKTLIM